ncbi:hypothetical protein AB0E04_48525 [Streptomyces sp. NPDC048251]|uniref:hypothetical protein n=1 Tax=Streptomyces sp. NPDC048251 TaxID=3154501 RepID=UPI0034188B34
MAFSSRQRETMAADLQSTGWLEISSPAQLVVQPGPRYWRRVPERRKRHALSPRIEAAKPHVRRHVVVPPASEDASPPGHGPDLTVRRVQDAAPGGPATSAAPRGIWLIPGARIVLESDHQ